ncbi:hypothetical protein TNCV_919001 [Trichonephila clavipes]|nr:hypothetical protein TNCV_919001 [Trichonephila clavipes]
MPTSSFNGVATRSPCVGSHHVERLTTGRLPKHSVRSRHLDAFTRGRIIGKLEEGRTVTSVAAEFGIVTASFHDFGDNFKLQ